jgi:hypothetical protein
VSALVDAFNVAGIEEAPEPHRRPQWDVIQSCRPESPLARRHCVPIREFLHPTSLNSINRSKRSYHLFLCPSGASCTGDAYCLTLHGVRGCVFCGNSTLCVNTPLELWASPHLHQRNVTVGGWQLEIEYYVRHPSPSFGGPRADKLPEVILPRRGAAVSACAVRWGSRRSNVHQPRASLCH